MGQQVTAKWLRGDKNLDVSLSDETALVVTADSPKATDLVLAGLVSCSARTLLTILGRMRVEIADLTVRATCEREEEPPKMFTRVDLYFDIWPGQTDVDRVHKALELSEKYCTVFNILKCATSIEVHHTLHSNG